MIQKQCGETAFEYLGRKRNTLKKLCLEKWFVTVKDGYDESMYMEASRVVSSSGG